MKQYDYYLLKAITRYDYASNASSVVAWNHGWYGKMVNSGVVKGDHKKPNAFWYYKQDIVHYDGAAYEYQGNYGSGPNPLVASYGYLDTSMHQGGRKGVGSPLQNLPSVHFDKWRDLTTCYNKALGKLNDKVRGGLDISVALAESHQTSKMLKSITKAERFIRGIGPRRWAKEWLEYSYGWKPLIGDVYDAANELIAVNNIHTTFKAKAHSLSYPRESVSSVGPVDVTNLSNYTDRAVTAQVKAEVFMGCTLQVKLSLPSIVQQKARWSSLNPISIAWELMPYSFVVDWFLDVGSYLRDQETAFLYNTGFESGFRSDIYRADIEETVSFYDNTPNYFTRIRSITATKKQQRISFQRNILDAYPCPNLPRVNTDLSSGRLITAAALLMQFIPVPKPVMARWMDLARPFISYGQLKKPKFAFRPPQNWSHELKW